MQYSINYNGCFFLDDDAVLYDNKLMRMYYGNLIPPVEDRGLGCDFNMGAISTVYPLDSLDICINKPDESLRITDIFKLGTEVAALDEAIYVLKNRYPPQEAHLKFPDPGQTSHFYCLGFQDSVRDKAQVLILHGLNSRERSVGVTAEHVANWLDKKAQSARKKIEKLNERKKELSDKEPSETRKSTQQSGWLGRLKTVWKK